MAEKNFAKVNGIGL